MILCPKGKGNKFKQLLQTTETVARTAQQTERTEWALVLGSVETVVFSTDLPFWKNGGKTTPVACDFGRRTSCSWETWRSKRCSPCFWPWFFESCCSKRSKRCPPESTCSGWKNCCSLFTLWCFLSLCDVYCLHNFHNFHIFFRVFFEISGREQFAMAWRSAMVSFTSPLARSSVMRFPSKVN